MAYHLEDGVYYDVPGSGTPMKKAIHFPQAAAASPAAADVAPKQAPTSAGSR
jgi:hypothetical protein